MPAVAVAAAVFAAVPLGSGVGAQRSISAETRAAAVAQAFFRSINARRYAETCDLLSARFYRDSHVQNKARCALGLRIGFTWAQAIRYRIAGVSVEGDRAVVSAIANGAPGQIVLIEEHGR